MKLSAITFLLLSAAGCSASAQSFDPRDPRSPLRLARTIQLPNVKGRIDHMALDAERNHLFVAEYGNGSVDDIDLARGQVVGSIKQLHEPQGVAWLPREQELAVASGDGLLSFYRGTDLKPVAVIRLGADADNVRVDKRNGNLVVGYGSGALAVIDAQTHQVTRRVPLPPHPEAFELLGAKVFVNVPDAHQIVIADLDQGRVIRKLSTGLHFGNYPMASDATGSRVAVAFRVPGTLSVIDAASGVTAFSAATCGDADDLYFRSRDTVVVCGSGQVELFDDRGHQTATVTTQHGARTGLINMASRELFIAVPGSEGAAAIWDLAFP